MIRRDHVEVAVRKRAPELFAIRGVADRRRTFVFDRAVRDLLAGEREIVRAGFGSDGNAGAAGAAERRQRERRARCTM
jgi:hypothetical protein